MKLIESNNDSSIIISPSDTDEFKNINDKLTVTNNNTKNLNLSLKKRACNLYPNGISDWDSTDSESGINDINGNYGEPESCQTRF